jgi:hypothetical protein
LETHASRRVEFDGPGHWRDHKQIERDKKKAAICWKSLLPLMRFGAPAFRRADHMTFLEWLLRVWLEHRDLTKDWDRWRADEERRLHARSR